MLKNEREKNEKRTPHGRAPSKITRNGVQTAKNNDRKHTNKKIDTTNPMNDHAQSKKGLSATGTS